MTEWFENSHFWEKMETFIFSHLRTPRETQREVKGIVRLLDLQKGDKVLDLGCGPGRILLPLARRGFSMTGVDITQSYLAELGHKASEENLEVKLIHEDMRKFVAPDKYEAIISVFSTFGYCADPHHDQKILKNIFGSLHSGGQLFLDLLGRDGLKRHHWEQNQYQLEDGSYVVENSTIKPRWDWVENHWTLVQGQHQKTFTFGMRIFSSDELKALLDEAGFKSVQFYGDFDGAPYNKEANRLIAVATKA